MKMYILMAEGMCELCAEDFREFRGSQFPTRPS
jgi:hypothetical protein